VITNKLDGIMLTNIIRAVDKQFIPRGKFRLSIECANGYSHHFIVFLTFYAGLYKLSVEILQNLAKVPRFGMIAMFLSPKEKQGESQSSVL